MKSTSIPFLNYFSFFAWYSKDSLIGKSNFVVICVSLEIETGIWRNWKIRGCKLHTAFEKIMLLCYGKSKTSLRNKVFLFHFISYQKCDFVQLKTPVVAQKIVANLLPMQIDLSRTCLLTQSVVETALSCFRTNDVDPSLANPFFLCTQRKINIHNIIYVKVNNP